MELKKVSHVVIGGGISGLSKALSLQEKKQDYVLLESSSNVGGWLSSYEKDGFILERGPNSFAINDTAHSMVNHLGIEKNLIQASQDAKNRYIMAHRELVKVSPPTLAFSGKVLSLKSRWKLMTEFARKKPPHTDGESVDAFVTRRISKEFSDRLINAVVGGIYAGDPTNLCLASVFPKMKEMEDNYGSLIKAAISKSREKKSPRELVTFDGGLSTLAHAIYDRCKSHILTESPVLNIKKKEDAYWVEYRRNGASTIIQADHVHFTCSAKHTADILDTNYPEISLTLREIEYAPIISINVGYHKDQIPNLHKAFGFLVPKIEKCSFLGCIYKSAIFPHMAPKDHHLLTIMVGGMQNLSVMDNPEESITKAITECQSVLSISGDPVLQESTVIRKAIPQYTLGHQNRVKAFNQFEAKNKGIHFSGNWLRGVAIGDCIANNYSA